MKSLSLAALICVCFAQSQTVWNHGGVAVFAPTTPRYNFRSTVGASGSRSRVGNPQVAQKPQQVFSYNNKEQDGAVLANSLASRATSGSNLNSAKKGLSQLATKFLADIGEKMIPSQSNIIISPFSIWALSLMLLQAADGRTAEELANLLGMQSNPTAAASTYRTLANVLLTKTASGEFSSTNFLLYDKKLKINRTYSDALDSHFEATAFRMNKEELVKNAQDLNDWVGNKTNHRIQNFIKAEQLENLSLFVGNIAYFKGQWKYPFKEVFLDEFKSETTNKITGGVEMMVDKFVLNYGVSKRYNFQMVDIPYSDNKFSMVVLLPKPGKKIQEILNQIKGLTLEEFRPDMNEEDVDLYLPKFTIKNELFLNVIYEDFHVKDMFVEGSAAFPGFSNQAFVSKIYHVSEIITNEVGTEASAATGAEVTFKASAATFHANRPFIYFVADIPNNSILFSGVIIEAPTS